MAGREGKSGRDQALGVRDQSAENLTMLPERKLAKTAIDVPSKWIRNRADEIAVDKGCRWVAGYGEHFCQTVEQHFRLYEGRNWAGQLVKLQDWQRDFFMRLFSWVIWSDHHQAWLRRFRRARLWIPKKNGKSPSAAFVGNYCTFADGERGGKTYSIARTIKQGKIVHKHATSMVEQSPILCMECRINRGTGVIRHPMTMNEYLVVSGENRESLEGENGSFIIDEGHVMDARTYAIIEFAGASRMEPIELMVSTAGKNIFGWGKQQFDYGEEVNEGKVENIEFLHEAYAAPQDATDKELLDPKIWKQANPSLGTIIDPAVFERELHAARRSRATWASFKMYRFNMWGQSSSKWLEPRVWDEAVHDRTIGEFAGCPAYLGLDMSLTRDMTGAVLIVPVMRDGFEEEPELDEAKTYYLFPLLWITRPAVDRWSHKVPYHEWSDSGYVKIIEHPKIDFGTVRKDIVGEFGITDVQSITYDATYAVETAEMLSETLQCEQIEFRQTLMEYAEPTQAFERLLSTGLLFHPDNKTLTWQSKNVEITTPDRSGNYRPVKPATSDKDEAREAHRTIDGIQAAVMALREARHFTAHESYYEDGEVEMY